MAYNVVKGRVEFSGPDLGTIEDMVDTHTDQTIGGTKTFTQMVTASMGLSASMFYGDGSGLTGVSATSPIEAYNLVGNNRVITSVDSITVQGEENLLFDGTTLTINGALSASSTISGSEFYGSGTGLSNIGATNINLGQGIENDGSNNIRVKLDSTPALARSASGIKVDLTGLANLDSANIASNDLFLIYDDSTGANRKFSFSSLTTNLGNTLTFAPAGANTQVQYNDGGDHGASSNFTFNPVTNTLSATNSIFTNAQATTITASSHVSASTFYGDGSNLTGITSIPSFTGSNTEIQFNADGIAGSSPNLTFATSSNTLATVNVDASNTITATNISASSHVSASTFYGDGSNLTGVTAVIPIGFNSFSADFIVSSSYDVIGIDSSSSVVTGSLLSANSYSSGKRLFFKDIGGSAATNNISIEAAGSDVIDGAISITIDKNYGAIQLFTDGVSKFYILGTN